MADNNGGGAAPDRASAPFGHLGVQVPSLDWTLARLTGTWVEPLQMISCPLPGHDDSTPSFNLWDPNDDGVPQRFGCFGCGRRGDAVDLISILLDIPESAALVKAGELAEEEARDDTPRERARPVVPVVDHDVIYQRIVSEFSTRALTAFQRFAAQKDLSGEALETYLLDEWDWSGTPDGWVVIPHRGPDGSITGIKYRRGAARRNEQPSRFPHLYGTWRDKGHPVVALCEGETDTVWTAWSLKDDEVDVFGLPSGAQQEIASEWLDRLADRTLILMFDGDGPGMEAARRWVAARPDALLARLPEGEDVLSCGIPVIELISRAGVPRRASGLVTVERGIFVKNTQNGSAPLSDFAFRPERELYTDDGPAWEGTLSGSQQKVLLRASDLHSNAAITRWANRHGRSWTGTGTAVQGVFNYLAAESAFLPLERAMTKAGKISRSYVGPGFCIGPDRIRYIPPALGDAKLETKLNIVTGDWDARVIYALEKLNDPAVMATILGWLCATLIRGERAPAPPLFVAGESGAGKTNLLSSVLGAFGFNTETNLTTTTPYGVDCLVSSCIGFPVWFDEYRGGAREDSMTRLRQLLRDAYYGQPSMKGGMTTQATELTEVTTWAGIIVSGEMSSHETSHRDRMVMLDLDPEQKNRDAYKWLHENEARTVGLGHDLLTFLAKRPDSLFRVVPQGPDNLPDRFRDTLGYVQTGWDAWLHFRWEQGLTDTPEGPDFSMLSGQRREVDDPWLEAIKVCEGTMDRNANVIVQQTDEGVVLIPAEIVVEARRVGIELPARANELVQWLKRRYAVENVRVGSRRGKFVKGMRLGE